MSCQKFNSGGECHIHGGLCAGCMQAVFVCCVLSVQGVTGSCCCTGVSHLRAISWASYGVETPEGGPCRSTFTEGSCGIPLVSVFTRVMFRGVWKLQPRRPSPEPPLCFQLQTQLLISHLKTSHQAVCPPSNVKSPTIEEFPGKEETQAKKQSTSSSENCSQPVSLKPPWKRTYFPPVFPRTQPLETPGLSASSSPGSSLTFIPVS
ncbi:hypothetical protein ATANTOWER_021757 [Ataeniobius toweri]|uniref:Uncharacterized protein n=1 Tax=Ataeniobius toweri TaxID=208326 RepID=A0ABU7BRA9_9TELE|nr:hypothetical protein [Ataeniobius toweri]